MSKRPSNSNKLVLFVPDYSEANPYQKMLADELSDLKTRVCYDKFYPSLFPLLTLWRKNPKIDVIHLHWIVDLIAILAWSKNPFIFKVKCYLLRLDCFVVRALGVKIVWTIHNKFAHQQLERSKELQVRSSLVKSVNQIIVHSKEALSTLCELYQVDFQHKARVIFHGNYAGVYPSPSADKAALKSNKHISQENKVIAYIGMIRPYKGVDKLIEALKKTEISKVTLLIAGAPLDKAYGKSLISQASAQPNILFDLKFLSDQELVDSLAISDIICLPFSDTLTSGSVILAMTMGKALILPESAKVFGCVPQNGAIYFSDADDLANILSNIHQIDISQMGIINLQAANNMPWSKAAQLTNSLYCAQGN
ncbi:glycosyltransferase family 4 protein [Paraglaciecola sp.]|uniref:glycosyltransferase family 4 protein n=1 Tax=Paraglaciecola sp. TaxID=1920173 RepID=UPI00273FE747|nr:glycosyltransferase family 4 protein [Paraglaciecola sp.]MDP5032263.1 glycosyltransferase family 4 protein [Paraglaciecola sp.]